MEDVAPLQHVLVLLQSVSYVNIALRIMPVNGLPNGIVTRLAWRNISLLSMVGHGVMGKTTLLQCVRGDEITNEFDLKIWGLAIIGEIVKKKGGTLGSALAAKAIGGVLKDNLDEMHWRTVLENNLLGQNPINSILKLSYIVLPKHLQNCFAFFVACSYKIMSLIKMT
ncbi:hypothetical protein IEQ34_016985 [Dendrobium chrysotoxum]|uniref:NB-ARC domain-containing protein n=1 Tax=Dendrobium chrysotoxum TaxID=161865 RepID=A0AAV7GG69_DENCH|nr:hypothetical protein IEQ34_016985 [Dendrobium chrysotoxum]